LFSRCFQSGGAGIGERSALIGGAPSARSRAPQKATSQAGQDISGSPPDRGHGRPAPHHVPGPAGGSAFCARDPADPVLVGIAGARETPPNSPVTPTPKNTARLGSPRTAQCRPNGPSGQHPAAAESSWEPCRRVGISAVVHDPRQSDRGTSGRTFGLIVLADLVRAEAAPGGRWPDGAVSGAPLYRGIRCTALPRRRQPTPEPGARINIAGADDPLVANRCVRRRRRTPSRHTRRQHSPCPRSTPAGRGPADRSDGHLSQISHCRWCGLVFYPWS